MRPTSSSKGLGAGALPTTQIHSWGRWDHFRVGKRKIVTDVQGTTAREDIHSLSPNLFSPYHMLFFILQTKK
jgi:hypothetical protein